jgi:hypothetical protein
VPSLQTFAGPQFVMQLPQCAGSVLKFVHMPGHALGRPGGHIDGVEQTPATHGVPIHGLPHLPQLRGSFAVSTHSSPHCVFVHEDADASGSKVVSSSRSPAHAGTTRAPRLAKIATTRVRTRFPRCAG